MKPINTDLIPAINDTFEISLSHDISLKELKEKLTVRINLLINHDFEKLVSLLYRIDVNENKLRYLLGQKGDEDAAELIADLIIERQLQKIKGRKDSKSNNDIPDNERW